ncbi:restriction endonuclease subunit S [Mycoplasma sp. 46852]|uniref:restriction endonuclease subunit S n=1 Tax=Mycoplasma sp. 46852 TaxID=3401683 RepID=UPI003AAA40F5
MQKEKLVPAIRFKGFDEEWKEKKLSNLAEIYDGIHETPKYTKSGVMFLSVEDIDSLKSNKFVSYEYYKRMYKIYPQKNDIFMTRIGSVGVTNIIQSNEIMAYYVSLALIKSKINPFFLNQTLKNPYSQKEIFSRTLTTAIPQKINKNEIDEILIHFSDSDYEQQKIGLFLSNLDILIHSQELKLEKLQTIKQSLLSKMFASYDRRMPEIRFKEFNDDWNTDKVCDLFKITRGEVLSQNQISRFQNEIYAYPVYSSQTLKNGLMGYYKEYLFDNCITWTTDGANAGTVKYRNEKFYCTNVCGVLEEGKLKPNNCFAELLNLITPNHVTRAGNPKLMNSTMGDIIINYPNSTIEYTKISALFMSIDSLIHSCNQKLEKLNNIKQALLEKMFC